MKAVCAMFFWFLPLTVLCQKQSVAYEKADGSGCAQILYTPADSCGKKAVQLAENDIARGWPFLLAGGGFGAKVDRPSDKRFEQKLHLRYFYEGCFTSPAECRRLYNSRIFQYLQSTYGKTWWEGIRGDVIGFEEWKKSAKL